MEKVKNAWIRMLIPKITASGYIYKMAYRCPNCKWQQGSYSNYCPNCGLRLLEVE